MNRLPAVVVPLVVGAAVGACQVIAGYQNLELTEGGSQQDVVGPGDGTVDGGIGDGAPDALGDSAPDARGDATVDGGIADSAPDASGDVFVNRDGCPADAPGPPMVHVPASKSFCIDSTEVTNAQCNAFLQSMPSTANQPAACLSWNSSFLPAMPPAFNCPTFDPVGKPNLPVVCVDWCDAYAYCQWAGKRLCGDIAGGPVDAGSATDPAHSEWLSACSAAGNLAYPYGNSYVAAACNGGDLDARAPLAVGTLTSCQGGYGGLFDMSGNVSEWEDGCGSGSDGGPMKDNCTNRGDSFGGTAAELRCAGSGIVSFLQHQRSSTLPDQGFRCCSP